MSEVVSNGSPATPAAASVGEVAAELVALSNGTACFAEPRDVIVAAGPDTTRFLHGQLTQNVETLHDGEAAWSLLLQPNGRLVSLLRLHRIDRETILIDLAEGQGSTALAALSRFLIRTKCTLTLHADVPGYRLLTQPTAAPVGPEPHPRVVPCAPWVGWLTELVPTSSSEAPAPAIAPPQNVRVVSPSTVEVWRVQQGEPRFGVDLKDTTLPSETGLQSCAVAFGKGCYTGQELVERIDSRGRVVRSLMRIASSVPIADGDKLTDPSGADRGEVTSAVHLPDGTWAGIALVRKTEEPLIAYGVALGVSDLIDHAE